MKQVAAIAFLLLASGCASPSEWHEMRIRELVIIGGDAKTAAAALRENGYECGDTQGPVRRGTVPTAPSPSSSYVQCSRSRGSLFPFYGCILRITIEYARLSGRTIDFQDMSACTSL